jgi:hypothetical protein
VHPPSVQPVTVTLRHPHAALLATTGRGVVGTHRAVVAGEWAAIADLCGDEAAGSKVRDVESAREALNGTAADSRIGFLRGFGTLGLSEHTEDLDAGSYAITGPEDLVVAALDLFSRLLCGQWDEAHWHSTLSAVTVPGRGEGSRLNALRGHLCHTYEPLGREYRSLEPHEFPAHPSAAIGIAQAPLPAQVAYYAYKALGGGTANRPTFTLPHGPLTVEVEGQPVGPNRGR